MRIDHVEMALVDGHVDRLADRAARVVQPGSQVREFDEVMKILEGAVAPAALESERRAARRRAQIPLVAADRHVASGVARVLGKLRGRGAAHDLARKPGRYVHPAAVGDRRAGFSPESDRLFVAADLEPNLLEQ